MNVKQKKQSKQKKFTTISIPTPLFKKIEERIKNTGFNSVPSYVIYVLNEIITEEEGETEEHFTKKDEDRVKARLRALGYID